MSALTKPCDTCAGNGRPVTFWNGVVDCADCAGTGCVPDVEAALRAENKTLRRQLDALAGGQADGVLALARALADAGTATLRAELDAARAENARLRDIIRHNAPVVVGVCSPMVNVELDKRDAEIARLTAEVDRMTALYRKADDGHDENMRETARLIGEVERLTADNSYARDDIGRLYDVVWRLTKHHGTACKTRQRMTAPRCASPCDQCDIDDAAMVAIGAGILHHEQKDTTP